MTRPAHLGIDVGGTASRWVVCDATGAVVARGEADGATGHLFNPAEKERLSTALRTIARSLEPAGLNVASLAAGITGYGSAVGDELKVLAGDIFDVPSNAIMLMDDIVLAYAANFTPGEGHLISAGTGSIGVHIGATGQIVRVGGRGILIDDAGSGSWIALRALDCIYRSLDHQGSFASVEILARKLFGQVGGDNWSDVRQFVYSGDRGRIGGLAVAVAAAADEGDQAALAILRDAGAELAQLAKALMARAGEAPVRFVGGVLRLHPVILEEVRRNLFDKDVRRSDTDAALAAARLQAGNTPAWAPLLSAGLSIAHG
ncbi:N-acetylglucosamine kinase [Pelagibacterium limicola]|uniref:N-acetylglucosamine kinase n=1 Tax=Pelagibacterium limicola TaxID=2791022 RepID=UPI0018B01191|nr:BadF/BadG/BcrA/BcrD ATPase family protein [Pelagibacterium limicola]